MKIIFPDGTVYSKEKELVLPNPVVVPDGWLVVEGDGQKPVRARHDAVSRTFNLAISQTNETVVLRPYEGGVVDWRSKQVTQLDKIWAWVDKFIELMTYYIWSQYIRPGFGYQDTNDDNVSPDVGPFKQQSLTCGGNLLNVLGNPIWTTVGAHIEVQVQDFYKAPQNLTYDNAPHLVTKQILVGNDSDKNTYYIVDQKRGDITWPMVCRTRLAISVSDIEYIPELPFYTTLNGVPVRINAYLFSGSSTYGRVDGNWYLLEEMEVTGAGSCILDRRLKIGNWIGTYPPAIKGWTRQPSLLEKFIDRIKSLIFG